MRLISILFLCLLSGISRGELIKVGDVIENSDGSKGVVFWVAPGGRSGWMAALHDLPQVKPWGALRDVPALQNTGVNTYNVFYAALADTSGYANTRKLRDFQGRGSAYAAQCVDFSQGWYLPAMGQLRKLYSVMLDVNAVLGKIGGAPLKTEEIYLSSTEGSVTENWSCSLLTGQAGTVTKNVAYYVRPVRNFHVSEVKYDTTLTYEWNTGESKPAISAVPLSTTDYRVKVTSAVGCSNTAQQLIFVASADPVILTDSICAGEVYRKNGFEVSRPGEHSRILRDEAGCEQLIILRLKVIEPKQTLIVEEICEGEVYRENNFNEWEAGVYRQSWKTAGGCDSVVILTLSVYPAYHTEIYDTICEGEVYDRYGFRATTAGDHYQELHTGYGCDSLLALHLTVHPVYHKEIYDTICAGEVYNRYGFTADLSGDYYQELHTGYGCDSLLALHLTVRPAYQEEIFDTICQGDIYNRYGFFATEAGDYRKSLQSLHGCDSVFTLHLAVNPAFYPEIYDTICAGDNYQRYGFQVTEAGDYYRSLRTVKGCDSLITLHLAARPVYHTEIFDTVCAGNTYLQYGFNVSEAGDYTHFLQTEEGCDSLVTLHLAMTTVFHPVIYDTICEGEIYNRNGFLETEGGTYNKSLEAESGCDSLVTLHLTVHPVYFPEIFDTICKGDIYHQYGFQTTEAGDHYQFLQTVNGCDSLVTLHLAVHPVYAVEIFDTICEGDTYYRHGFQTNQAGDHYRPLQTMQGCDSLVTLHLTVHPAYHSEIFDTICAGNTYHNYGFVAATPGDHVQTHRTIHGCDSTITLHLVVSPVFDRGIEDTVCAGDAYFKHGFSIQQAEAGDEYSPLHYLSIHGCDSTVRLKLTVNPRYEQFLEDTVCYGEDYLKNGYSLKKVKSSGFLPDQYLLSEKGCDSLVHCFLTVLPVYDKIFRDTVCAGSAYRKHGFDVQEAVPGQDAVSLKLHTTEGCDSTVYLFLMVHETHQTYLEEMICTGEKFDFRGKELQATGLYYDTLRNQWGCDSVLALQLYVNPVYRDTIHAAICRGGRYQQNGFDEADEGLYFRGAHSLAGCDSVTYLDLKVHDYFGGEIKTMVEDCSQKEYSFGLTGAEEIGEIRCIWDFGDGHSSEEENAWHAYADTGFYRITLKAETAGNCLRTIHSGLYVPYYEESLKIYASSVVIDSDHPTVCFWTDANKNMQYKWIFGDNTTAVGDTVCHTWSFDKSGSLMVKLEGINAVGCRTQETLLLDAYYLISPPNTFSPNGDGRNDYFMKGYKVKITDRNGLEIFKGENGWDGTRQGKPAPEDTYFYEVQYLRPEGPEVKKGFITLVR